MKFILALLCLFTLTSALAETKCTLSLRPIGIYYTSCPRGTLADGVDVFHQGPSPYSQVRVRCVQPEFSCVDLPPTVEAVETGNFIKI